MPFNIVMYENDLEIINFVSDIIENLPQVKFTYFTKVNTFDLVGTNLCIIDYHLAGGKGFDISKKCEQLNIPYIIWTGDSNIDKTLFSKAKAIVFKPDSILSLIFRSVHE